MQIAAAPFPASFQTLSDSEQSWTVFSMKIGKHKELKDKPISSHCISFTAICLWRWKLAAPEKLSAWTIGTDHVIAVLIFSSWVASPLISQVDSFPSYTSESAAGASSFMWTTLDALSLSLSYITSARYAVWTVGTDRQKDKYAPKTKQDLVRATMQRRSVQCVLAAHLHLNKLEHTKDTMWIAISSFLWWE